MGTPTIDHVVACLDRHRQRATYGAVCKVTKRGAPVGMGRVLKHRGPLNSWVVNQRTGEPTGYTPAQKHPHLYDEPKVIRTEAALRALLRKR